MGIQKSPTIAVGLLEIGQSQKLPDPDFLQLGKDKAIDFVTLAPLDAYTEDELSRSFKPALDELPISSITASGQRILLSRSALERELQKGVREARIKGLIAVVVTCTGEFDLEVGGGCTSDDKKTRPEIDQGAMSVILPGDLLHERVRAQLLGDEQPLRRVAVLVPVDEQKELLTERWVRRLSSSSSPTVEHVEAFTLSPQSSLEACRRLGESLATDLGFDAVVMDCFGYSLAQYKAVRVHVPRTFNTKAVSIDHLITVLK